VQGLCESFVYEQYLGTHVFGTDTFKMALYLDTATIGPQTTAYTATGEVSGPGYTAGGVTVTGVAAYQSNAASWVSFSNPEWTNASFAPRGALLYNTSKSNKAVLVLDFGQNRPFTGTFRVMLPPSAATSAILRSRVANS
jgi:hypothetical protein